MSEQAQCERRIDALVAEHVFGTKVIEAVGADYVLDLPPPWVVLPRHSTSIEAAWQVFEAITHGGELEKWIVRSDTATTMHWECVFDFDYGRISERAATAPMAICLAALKAKGVDAALTPKQGG
jgi:hypothetical protein